MAFQPACGCREFCCLVEDDPGPEVPYGDPVVIIGAGAAGLYAADILHAKGINVIILEAGNQLGGRVRSLRNQTGIGSNLGRLSGRIRS